MAIAGGYGLMFAGMAVFLVVHGFLGYGVAVAAPWLGARLWTAFNPRLPFALTAAALLIIILPVWIKFRRPENPARPAEIPVK